MPYDFSPNPNPHIETLHVGNEKQPVLVVDDCLLAPQAVVDFAATEVQFGPPKQMYPGIVAPTPREYVNGLMTVLAPLIRDTFGVSIERARVNSFFATVTLRPEQLNVGQRLPHIDTPNPTQIAILHYLCDASHGGTAFYRHRATGFESCDNDQFMQVVKMLQEDEAANGPLAATYITGSNRIYEQTAQVDAKFNRVLIYRSRVFHSASISTTANFSPDPRVGRLTANTFLAFQ